MKDGLLHWQPIGGYTKAQRDVLRMSRRYQNAKSVGRTSRVPVDNNVEDVNLTDTLDFCRTVLQEAG